MSDSGISRDLTASFATGKGQSTIADKNIFKNVTVHLWSCLEEDLWLRVLLQITNQQIIHRIASADGFS
jgi:hypothetical protein